MTSISPHLVPRAGSRWKRPPDYDAAFRGHEAAVNGALVLADGRILSWSDDTTLRLWRSDGTADGEPLRGHRGSVEGALVLPRGRLLSWSGDGMLRFWRADGMQDGEPLRGHLGSVKGARVLPDERIVSWG